MKSKLLLLDANVIIAAHEKGLWVTLYSRFELYVPSTVSQQEAKFFKKDPGTEFESTEEIELKPLLVAKKIYEIEATLDEVEALQKKLSDITLEVLGDGETEALAIILGGRLRDGRFITADGPAIQVLGALAMSASGASFEQLMEEIGQAGQVKHLPQHHKKDFYKRHVADGYTRSKHILR